MEEQSLGEFAMPLLEGDSSDEAFAAEHIQQASIDMNLKDENTNRSPIKYGGDVYMKSFDSSEELFVDEKPKNPFKRALTPLEIQMYSVSPNLNKYADTRVAKTVGSSTSEEWTGDLNRSDSKNSELFLFDNSNILELGYVDDGMIDQTNTFSYSNFLKAHSCYDIIPSSSKIVVVDTKLKVKKAFFALVHNNIRSAPVWDSAVHDFVGMLTITDFISILIRYYKSPLEKMWELEEHKIETWRDLFKKNLHQVLLRISPTESIFTAVQVLMKNKIHRLPVIDLKTGNALYILTHKKILRYVYLHLDDLVMPDFLGCSLQQLGLGTYKNIATIYPWTTVIDALRIFADRGVSALPIVDDQNKCVDIYSKFDVINLAAERTYNNLDVSVQEALLHRQEGFEGVHKCCFTESLYVIIDRIVNARVHRLVVVDDEDRVLGIISLSDILRFLVLQPPKIDIK